MHILVLNHNTRGQGTYWRALQFARGLHALGHEVTMMCVARDKRYRARRSQRRGFTLFETPHWAPGLDPQEGWGPLDLLFRDAHTLARRVDLVLSFSHKVNCIAPAKLARRRWSCPWVSDWCDWWGGSEGLFQRFVIGSEGFQALPWAVRRWRQFIFKIEMRREERVRHRADVVTTICTSLAQRAVALGIAEERIRVIPSGAPTDSIRPGNKREARRELGIKTKGPVWGYMANMHLDEDLLLGAFSRLLEEHPQAVLLVMGPPFDHPERLLTEEQIARSVRVLGTVPFNEIGNPLAASDALLMPLSNCLYNWGRWPNKIGDYLAAGRPVVCTAVGDAPDLVRRHEVGWVGEASEEGLVNAMIQAWEERKQWREMGKTARQVAETDLSWNRLTRDLAGAVLDRTGLQLIRQ